MKTVIGWCLLLLVAIVAMVGISQTKIETVTTLQAVELAIPASPDTAVMSQDERTLYNAYVEGVKESFAKTPFKRRVLLQSALGEDWRTKMTDWTVSHGWRVTYPHIKAAMQEAGLVDLDHGTAEQVLDFQNAMALRKPDIEEELEQLFRDSLSKGQFAR